MTEQKNMTHNKSNILPSKGINLHPTYADMRRVETEIMNRDDLTEEQKYRLIDRELLLMESLQRDDTSRYQTSRRGTCYDDQFI